MHIFFLNLINRNSNLLKSIKQNNNLEKNNDDNILRPNFKKLVFINEIYKNIFKINERINCLFFCKGKEEAGDNDK
jgi:hypothetical protein